MSSETLTVLRRPDRYHVLEPLGEGAVGIVDRVFDARLGRIVARKTLRQEVAGDENALRTFVNEAKVLGHLDHPNIIPIFDSFLSEDGRPVYTMREITGTSLEHLIRMDPRTGEATPVALDRTLKIVTQLAEALSHAHDRGVLHLDLKPQNIIVLAHDEVVLVDWGSARFFAAERYAGKLDDHEELKHLARVPSEDASLLIGTPRYMSPEQTERSRAALRETSDVFSLGIVFYQLLTGRLPFHGESLESLLADIRQTEPPAPRSVDLGIHRRLSDIVMRMLAKAPAERYASLDEVLGDLEEFRSTAAEFPIETFAAGEAIFSERDAGDAAYVVVDGEVEIWTGDAGDRRTLARNGQGEAFGELALLRDMPRSASATAVTDATVRVIGQSALMNEVEKLSPWVLAILSGVVERFIDRSDRLVGLLRNGGDAAGTTTDRADETEG